MNGLIRMVTISILATSCGTANVNKVFGSKDESSSGLLQRAQLAYDRNDMDAAEEYAVKAYDSTENNGDAAVLLSNIMLNRAGIDIFQLVGKLAETSSAATSTAAASTSTTCAVSDKDAAGSISRLSCLLLNLSEADIAALGTDVPLTSAALKSLGSYYRPNLVDDTLRAKVNVLKYADRGVRYLCPFVSRSVVLLDSIDERHSVANCGDKSSSTFNQTKVHIGFALLHLVESLVYQKGVLVDGVSSSDSTNKVGISTISSSINTTSFTSVTEFVSSMDEFKRVVNELADTANSKSQIALALDGIMVVAQAFGAAGVPSKVTASITGGLAKLKETANKLSTAAGGATGNYQAQALKGQINQKYSKVVSEKITAMCGATGDSCSPTQRTELCTSYAGISEGVDPSKVSQPSFCDEN